MIEAEELHKVFRDCLYKDEEITDNQPPPDCVLVEGITQKFGFHPDRLENHREEVKTWLSDLPDEFMVGKGGGWSFLNACMDRYGNQWGEHQNIQELFCLGMGLGMVTLQLPRELWRSLPGGMPYYCVDVTKKEENNDE